MGVGEGGGVIEGPQKRSRNKSCNGSPAHLEIAQLLGTHPRCISAILSLEDQVSMLG